MSFDIGDALLAGLNGGLQAYGAQRAHQQDLDEAAAAATAKEAYEKRMKAFGASLEAPKYNTFDTTDGSGNDGKRTMRSHYDAASGKVVDEDLGFTPSEAKAPTTRNVIQGGNEATQQYNPKTGQWETIGEPGPRFAPKESDGKTPFEFNDYLNADPAKRALYDRFRRGEDDPTAKADTDARKATIKDVQDLESIGKHPNDSDRAKLLYNNETLMNVDPFKTVKSWQDVTGDATKVAAPPAASPLLASAQPPVSQPGAPTAQRAPFPEGTKVKGPDGRLYVVRNGKPVPIGMGGGQPSQN